jgi:type VI secretion system secreted protein Hcp
MARTYLVTVKGATQGDITGGSTRKDGDVDYSKGFEATGFDYDVEIPCDPNSGVHTGHRRHSTVKIRKQVDKATPKLFQACITHEQLTTVKIQFIKPTFKGGSAGSVTKTYYTIELTNATIVKDRQYHEDDATNREQHDIYEQEELELTFQKITLTIADGGITAADDWLAT